MILLGPAVVDCKASSDSWGRRASPLTGGGVAFAHWRLPEAGPRPGRACGVCSYVHFGTPFLLNTPGRTWTRKLGQRAQRQAPSGPCRVGPHVAPVRRHAGLCCPHILPSAPLLHAAACSLRPRQATCKSVRSIRGLIVPCCHLEIQAVFLCWHYTDELLLGQFGHDAVAVSARPGRASFAERLRTNDKTDTGAAV